jgi:hypothetical protein
MQINRVDLYSGNMVRHIPLGFRDPYSSKAFQVRAIYGLDATDIVAKFVGNPSVASTAGGGFNIPTLNKREITVTLGLNPWLDPDTTYSSLRDEVYRLMCGCRTGSVKIRFVNDTMAPVTPDAEQLEAMTVAELNGFVTKVEASHFEKAPAIQLSVDCSDQPMLTSLERAQAPFPTSNTFQVTDAESTAIHGFVIAGVISDATDRWGIKNSGGMEWEFKAAQAMTAGTSIYMSSEHGKKDIYMEKSGVRTYLADKLTANSVWPIMLPGTNSFQMDVAAGFQFTELSYLPTYWGV